MKLHKGKLTLTELQRFVLSYIPSVETPNLDFSVTQTPSGFLISASDPVIGVPLNHYGFFSVHYSVGDVALSGIQPQYLILGIYYPPDFDSVWLEKNMDILGKEAKKLDIKILGGHTGAYDGLLTPIFSTTALAFTNEKQNILNPQNLKSGDSLIIVGPVTREIAWAVANFKPDIFSEYCETNVEEIASDLSYLTVLDCAIKAADNGAVAMHDLAEGGLITALHELSHASNLGIEIDSDLLPWDDNGHALVKALDGDVFSASSFGSILIGTKAELAEDIVKELKSIRPCAIAGHFTSKKNVILKKNGKELKIKKKEDIYSKLL
ncbi:MAG: AIR synthase-related protein [Promethearchaeota archaeon]